MSENAATILVLALFFAGLGLRWWWRRAADRRRRDELCRLAAERGWSFEAEWQRREDLRRFELFENEYNPRIRHRLRGQTTAGLAFELFDTEVHGSPHSGNPPRPVSAVLLSGPSGATPTTAGPLRLQTDTAGRTLAWLPGQRPPVAELPELLRHAAHALEGAS